MLTPALAGYLDRSEIVRRVQGYRLSLTQGDSWAEPLGSMIGRTVPDALVSLDVLRFDEGADGKLVLIADVCIQRGSDRTATAVRAVVLSVQPKSGATGDIVSAMSDLIGQLSDAVAGLVTTAT